MHLDQSWLAAQGEDAPLLGMIGAALAAPVAGAIGVAVSGGGDSMALLHLTLRVAAQTGHSLHAVTIDHGLRAEAAAEAAMVGRFCAGAGIAHETLRWNDWDGRGNLAAMARDARYRLIGAWAGNAGIDRVLLGHTEDDVAETFLMRLARKAGIDGLAQMRSRFDAGGLGWARPLLAASRADLRAYLRRQGVGWAEDPSNEDPASERARMRAALDVLAGLGIDTGALAHAARAARDARATIEYYTRLEADKLVTVEGGDLVIAASAQTPMEMIRRLQASAVQWQGGLAYPPRDRSMQAMRQAVGQGAVHTVGGCRVQAEGPAIRFAREFNAVKDMRCGTDVLWDGRWRLCGPHAPDLHIAALGDAVAQCAAWRDTGLPRASLMASPAVWRGDALIAAPLAGDSATWTAQIVADFHRGLVSH